MGIELGQKIIDTCRGKIKIEDFGQLKFLLVLKKLKNKLLGSYSQYGEDLILSKLLKIKKNGFYLDIGANHPKELSNTAYFYNRGFTGVNIEANPNLIQSFNELRKKDINLNLGISNQASEMTFYLSSADTLSSFNLEALKESCEIHGAEIIGEIRVKTDLLQNIIEKYAKDKNIDFMSVDVEGHDLEVLQSNNWDKYRPDFLIIETNINTSNISQFIEKIDYKLVYKNHTNSIYKDCRKAE